MEITTGTTECSVASDLTEQILIPPHPLLPLFNEDYFDCLLSYIYRVE